ncbi:MAG: hypothetical protein U0441_07625 [Polyangiaceae bacterium]
MRSPTRRLGLTFAFAIGLFTAGAAITAALAAPPPDSAPHDTPPPTATVAATEAPSASAAATPEVQSPLVRGADIPASPSPKPKESEWKEARKVAANVPDKQCDLTIVREWLRVTCHRVVGVGLIAGEPKDVTVWAAGTIFEDPPSVSIAQFPLTRGASRIFALTEIMSDWDWVGFAEGGTMSVVWREGDPDPQIRIRRTRESDQK